MKSLIGRISPTQLNHPSADATEITPADVDLPFKTRGIYVGVSGDLAVVMADSKNTVTFVGVAAGSVLPLMVTQIKAATTATGVIALY